MAAVLSRLKLRLRSAALRRLDADHAALDAFVRNAIVDQVVAGTFSIMPQSTIEWQRWFEEAYRVCQHRGCALSGWHLRFAIYYRVGKMQGLW